VPDIAQIVTYNSVVPELEVVVVAPDPTPQVEDVAAPPKVALEGRFVAPEAMLIVG
jgi:hypothetical protein